MDERREGQHYIVEAIKRIDSRTEGIDARLRDVEKKIYNGFTTEILNTSKKVDTLIQEQTRLRIEAENERAKREAAEKHRAAVYKAIGAFAAISGVVFGIVSLL